MIKLEDPLRKYVLHDLLAHEGFVSWPYCDHKGFVTIGIGNLVPSATAMCLLPLTTLLGTLATATDKAAAWARVAAAFEPGLAAGAYRNVSAVRMRSVDAQALCLLRVERDFVPRLMQLFHDFFDWPLSAQRVAIDMIYSLGAGKFGGAFVEFVAACQARDWAKAARECVRKSGRRTPSDGDPDGLGRRNLWARNLLLSEVPR